MSNVLVVIGSARKGRVADKVLGYIQDDLKGRENLTATIADLKEINLPFFDNEYSPASPHYAPTNERVLAWQKIVSDADSIVFITPEYNRTLSAIQKNAFDSVHAEWENKPMVVVAYGWNGGSGSIATLNVLIPNIKGIFMAHPAQLAFMKDINPDGSLIEGGTVAAQIKAAIDEIA